MPQSQISRIEPQSRPDHRAHLKKIAKAPGVDVAKLIWAEPRILLWHRRPLAHGQAGRLSYNG